jgi:ribose/xylose/arabinose/galactoside ABC-type transport system permease subunit
VPLALAAMLLVAVAIGSFNGISVASFRMPPFMVTLVTLIAVGAFAIYLTHSENIRNLPGELRRARQGQSCFRLSRRHGPAAISRRQIYPLVTYPLLISRALAFAAHFVLSRTVFGRQVYAIGTNRRAAAVSGVPVDGSSSWSSSSRQSAP